MDYSLIFVTSLFASAHCIGMCGCFALLAGQGTTSVARRALAQAVYSAGRLFTYLFLGIIAGVAGGYLLETRLGGALSVSLSLLSGTVFMALGLEILGVWAKIGRIGRIASQFLTLGLGPIIRYFAGYQNLGATFAMGVFTGFLPCGLVYAFAMKAIASANIAGGALTMLSFGLGTVPAMAGVGMLGGLASDKLRGHIYRFSGVVLIFLGLLTIIRATPLAPILLGH